MLLRSLNYPVTRPRRAHPFGRRNASS
jgi:hypothetical protein